MTYNIQDYEILRITIESLRGSVKDSKIEHILSGLEGLNKQVLTNSVTNHPNNRQRDVDLIDIVHNYYKEIYAGKPGALKRRNKGKDNKLYVAMLDIDDFGKFNKKYGESVGDFVLAKTADIMRNTLRKDDTILKLSEESKSYHLHGEEKLIIFKSKSHKYAINVADKVRAAIEKNSKDEIGYPVTESIGLTTWDAANEGYLAAQHRADVNMQLAKRQGKNRVYFNDEHQISSKNVSTADLNDLDLNIVLNDRKQHPDFSLDGYKVGRRFGGENQLYVAMFQINDFSQLKDMYGKDTANFLLKGAYDIAAKTLKESDLSYIDGEKRMSMYKCRTDTDALRVAKKVVSAVEQERFGTLGHQIEESFGLARWYPKIEGLSHAQARAFNNISKY